MILFLFLFFFSFHQNFAAEIDVSDFTFSMKVALLKELWLHAKVYQKASCQLLGKQEVDSLCLKLAIQDGRFYKEFWGKKLNISLTGEVIDGTLYVQINGQGACKLAVALVQKQFSLSS